MAYSQSIYKRTVRCSYCYESGHNKSSCPQYAARIEEIRQESGDDHYAVAAYDRKKAKRKAKAKEKDNPHWKMTPVRHARLNDETYGKIVEFGGGVYVDGIKRMVKELKL